MITKTRNYGISRSGVYFNLKSFRETSKQERDSETVYFPSRGEFNCFLSLYSLFKFPNYEIRIHPREQFSGFRWEIDFKVIALNEKSKTKLALLANAINGSKFNKLDELLFEFKGFLDRNFLKKAKLMQSLTPIKFRSLIVLANEEATYIEDAIHLKICSFEVLQNVFNVLR